MQEMNEIEPDMLPGGGGASGFQVTGMIKWRQKSKPGFQVTGMIEWRQTSKPKKIPAPKFNAPKIRNRISEP